MFVCPCAFHMGILPSWKSFVHRCTVHMVTQSPKSFNTCIPVSFIREPYHHRNVRVPLCLSYGHAYHHGSLLCIAAPFIWGIQSSKLFNTCIPVSFIREPYHHRNVRVPLCLSYGHPTIMEVFCASLHRSYGNSIIKIVQYMYPRLFHKGTLPS